VSELLTRLRPVQLGWKSVMNANVSSHDLGLRRDAAELEAAASTCSACTPRRRRRSRARGRRRDHEARLAELTGLLEEGCARRGLELLGRVPGTRRPRASGIVTFVPKRAAERVRQELWARGVASTVRFGGIRLSPHHYQDQRDVESFFARLDDAEASAS
jgi:selenocysteine lyase/cysteine desulfurase